MKKIIVLLLVSIFLFEASASYSYTVTAEFSKYAGTNAALRSLVMPGWGQGWNEQYTKGWIVWGIFAVSVFGYFYYDNKAESDYRKYKKDGAVFGSRYDDYEDNHNISNICGIVAGVTWLYAVVDAFFTANYKAKFLYSHDGTYKKLDLVAYNDDGFMLKYKTKFSL